MFPARSPSSKLNQAPASLKQISTVTSTMVTSEKAKVRLPNPAILEQALGKVHSPVDPTRGDGISHEHHFFGPPLHTDPLHDLHDPSSWTMQQRLSMVGFGGYCSPTVAFPSAASCSANPAGRKYHARRTNPKGMAHKRPREEFESDAYSDQRNINTAPQDDCAEGEHWACPFYKFDPQRYYDCLGKYHLRRIGDVKQHLKRCHVIPENQYCAKCWTIFKSEALCRKHIIEGKCVETCKSEMLDGEEEEMLDDLPQGRPRRERWYSYWDTLFKGHQPPFSPFVKDGLEEPAELFWSRGSVALDNRLPSLLCEYRIQISPQDTKALAHDILAIVLDLSATRGRHRRHPSIHTDENLSSIFSAAKPGPPTLGDNQQQRVMTQILPATRAVFLQPPVEGFTIAFDGMNADLSPSNHAARPLQPFPLPDDFASFLSPGSQEPLGSGENFPPSI